MTAYIHVVLSTVGAPKTAGSRLPLNPKPQSQTPSGCTMPRAAGRRGAATQRRPNTQAHPMLPISPLVDHEARWESITS